MASIYKHPPFYKGEKKWDDNDTLSEVYKLQSNTPQNKSCIETHKDNGGYSIKFTVNITIPEFNKGAEKCELTWVDSFTEFENVLQGQHRTAWKQMLDEHFPEPVDATRPVPSAQDCNSGENFPQAIKLFLQRMLSKKKPKDRQYIYLQPDGDHIFQKAMMTKPLDHLCRFEEMLQSAKALLVGDMPVPKTHSKLSGSTCRFTNRTAPGTSRAENTSAMKPLRPLPSISTTSTTRGWPTAHSRRNVRSKLSSVPNANSATKWRSATTTRFAISRISATGTRIAATSKAIHIVVITTRNIFVGITTTIVVTIMPTNMKTMTARVSPSATTRPSSPLLISASKIQRIRTRSPMTRSAHTKRITMTSAMQAKTRSHLQVWIHHLQATTATHCPQRTNRSAKKSKNLY